MNRTGPLPQLESLAAHSDVYKDSQRMAILDLGSNSFRMIVVEYVPGLSFKVVDEIAESVRLSEGMGESNILRAAAMDRAVQAVQIFAGKRYRFLQPSAGHPESRILSPWVLAPSAMHVINRRC